MTVSDHINEHKAAEAFTGQSKLFDQLYGNDAIIHYKRARVREHILENLEPGNSLLELNCGSGEDALFFASHGYSVHATDISEGMLNVLNEKLMRSEYKNKISSEQCSFTQLERLKNKGPFDHVYSNFGGLNCTGEIEKVLHSLDSLVKPGGTITLVIISKFCLWETLLLFKGKFKTAFRRFFSKKGRKAHVEGHFFKCWYYTPSFIQKCLHTKFELLKLEGLCTIVPPSYIENFAVKYPRLFQFLKEKENRLKSSWPWSRAGDYFIISFRKKY
jgi:ubiquinone/menaquinone biosynthesis C-methylase UbiE